MPYKFNEGRRHKIPKARYRVTNWPEYDAALVRRGSLTVWFTEEAVAAWHAPATGERGGQPIYSAIAIETSLALRLVFHQPLRQTEGLLRSIADVLGINIAIPDHTTLSRRGGGLTDPAKARSIVRSHCIFWSTAPASRFMARANGSIRSTVSGRVGGGASCTSASMPTRMKSSRWN